MDSTIPSSAGRVREMSFVRPRYLAIAFSAFFGIVAYLAWSVAHASKGPWFEPDVSRTVYQTSMVGGVLVLIGLFVTASIVPYFARPVPREDAVTPGDLMDRLSDIRVRNSGPLVSEDREMTQVLVRLVNEIKPLLVASKQAGLNVPEIRRLVAEATAGREGDLSYRV